MVTCGGVLVFVEEAVGVHCPHGSELHGDDPTLCCWYVFWASAECCELAGATGLNVDVGLGMNPEVEGTGVLHRGYIPGHRNCLSMRSASLVTLSMMVIVESNFETPMMLSQGLTTRCHYCFKIRHYYILNTL